MTPSIEPRPPLAPAAARARAGTPRDASRRAAIRAAGIAAAIAAAAGAISVSTLRLYLARAPYYFDPASYRYTAVMTLRTLRAEGLRAALAEALATKDGLDVVLRLLVWPELLGNRFGHLAVALPCLALFAFLTIWYVHRRAGSVAAGAAIAATLFSAGLVAGPRAGVADYWKDSVGCWLLGSAALAWLLARGLRAAGWSAVSGLCLGLLLLQRTGAAVYAAPAFAVLFVLAVRARVREAGWRRSWPAMAAFAAPALALLALLSALQLRALVAYYSGFGYAYASAGSVAPLLWRALRAYGGAFLLVAPVAGIVLGRAVASWREQGRDVAAAGWLAAAFPAAIVLSRGVYDPGFFPCATVLGVVVLATLVPVDAAPARRRAAVLACAALVAAGSAWEVPRAFWRATRLRTQLEGTRRTAPAEARAWRAFQTRVAGLLLARPEPRVFKLAYTETGAEFWNLAFFDLDPGKALGLREASAFLSVHDSYYRAVFGDGASAGAIVERDLRALEELPGTLVVASCVPEEVRNQYWFRPDPNVAYQAGGNPLAAEVAVGLAAGLARGARWRCVAQLESPLGCMYVYEASPRPLDEAERWRAPCAPPAAP